MWASGVTPHAPTHLPGGGDPVHIVAGAGAQVFDGTAPTVWTDADLSGVVGAQRSLVLVMIRNLYGSGSNSFAVRENARGDEVWTGGGGGYGVSQVLISGVAGTRDAFLLVTTDAAGIVEWHCDAAIAAQAYVVAFWS